MALTEARRELLNVGMELLYAHAGGWTTNFDRVTVVSMTPTTAKLSNRQVIDKHGRQRSSASKWRRDSAYVFDAEAKVRWDDVQRDKLETRLRNNLSDVKWRNVSLSGCQIVWDIVEAERVAVEIKEAK